MDTVENRKVALKLIPHGDDGATRMIVEAERRGAAIQKELHRLNPRVVEIYEYGDLDAYFFVAMEFVEGRTVADVLTADHIVDPCRAAVIALEICEQLAKFHSWESAVVHGDIKPSNILLSPNDTVRLLDFGIAEDSARGLQCYRAQLRQPELLFAGAAHAQRSGSAVGFVGAGSDALRNARRRAAVPGGRYAQAGRADSFEASAARVAGIVPGRTARRGHEVAGAGGGQALPVGDRVSGGLAALSGGQIDLGGSGAPSALESHRHSRSGPRGAAPCHADGPPQAVAQPATVGCGGVLRNRHAALDRRHRLAGRCGRRAPAQRPGR